VWYGTRYFIRQRNKQQQPPPPSESVAAQIKQSGYVPAG
jgi:hypothetical protein